MKTDHKPRSLCIAALIFVAVFLVHRHSPNITVYDSTWVIPTALSIIRDGDVALDEYRPMMGQDPGWTIQIIRGHPRTIFPLGVSWIALPFVWAMDKGSAMLWERDLQAEILRTNTRIYERFIASAFVALTASIIYLMGRCFLNDKYALLLALIFAFCTSSWSVASRALWQHAPSMLLLTSALFLTLLAPRQAILIAPVGILLGFSYLVRPTNSIAIAAWALFFLVKYWRHFYRYLLGLAVVILPFLFYNWTVYHAILPWYYQPSRLRITPQFWEALAGNLISPARGLFVFSPVFLLSIYGAILKLRRGQRQALDYFMIAIVCLHWLAISSFWKWWGGYSYGPRLLCDTAPFFLYFLIPALAHIPQLSGWRKACYVSITACLILASFLVHYRGATVWDTWAWNYEPTDIDKAPARLWDWRDAQFLRGISGD